MKSSFRASLTTAFLSFLSAPSLLFVSLNHHVSATTVASPTSAQIAEILYWHNAARAEIARSGYCANMLYASWDTSAAAYSATNYCPTDDVTDGGTYGSNWAWSSDVCSNTYGLCSTAGNCGGTGQPACESNCDDYCTIKAMVYTGWYQGESTNANTIPNDCKSYSAGGGHCSQVNWQDSVGIGCTYQQNCADNGGGTTLQCNYSPPGNFNIPSQSTVYLGACVTGTQCSSCPSDYPYCITSGVFEGLCSATATTSTTAASTTTSTATTATATTAATTKTATTVKATTAAASTSTTTASPASTTTTAKPTTSTASTTRRTSTTVSPSSSSTTAAPTTSTPTTHQSITIIIYFNTSYPVSNTAWQQAFLDIVDKITGTTDAVSIASTNSSTSSSSITLSVTDSASTGLTATQIADLILASVSSSSSASSTESLASAYPGVSASEPSGSDSSSSSSSSSSSLSTTVIAIIAAVGGAVVLVMLAASAWWCIKRREKGDTSNTTNRLQNSMQTQMSPI